MKELLRTNDIVLVSYVRAVLADVGIALTVLDGHMSVVEGSIGALPRRLMVLTEDEARARSALRDAGLIDERGEIASGFAATSPVIS